LEADTKCLHLGLETLVGEAAGPNLLVSHSYYYRYRFFKSSY